MCRARRVSQKAVNPWPWHLPRDWNGFSRQVPCFNNSVSAQKSQRLFYKKKTYFICPALKVDLTYFFIEILGQAFGHHQRARGLCRTEVAAMMVRSPEPTTQVTLILLAVTTLFQNSKTWGSRDLCSQDRVMLMQRCQE